MAADQQFLARYLAGNREVARRWFNKDPQVPELLFDMTRPTALPVDDIVLDNPTLLDVAAALWNHGQQVVADTVLERDCLQAELYIVQGEFEQAAILLADILQRNPDCQRAIELQLYCDKHERDKA